MSTTTASDWMERYPLSRHQMQTTTVGKLVDNYEESNRISPIDGDIQIHGQERPYTKEKA